MVATIKVENYVCPIVTVALTMLCISNSVDGYTIVNTYYHSYSDSNCGDSCGSIYNNSTNSQSCEGSLVNYEDFYIAIYAVLMVSIFCTI